MCNFREAEGVRGFVMVRTAQVLLLLALGPAGSAAGRPEPPHATAAVAGTAAVDVAAAASGALVRVPQDVPTLVQALRQVANGGTVELATAIYPAPAAGFRISNARKSFTIRAAAGAAPVLDGGGHPVFVLRNSARSLGGLIVFQGLVFRGGGGGSATTSPGVTVDQAAASFARCRFENNAGAAGADGGGVKVRNGSTASFTGCSFTGDGRAVAGEAAAGEAGSGAVADLDPAAVSAGGPGIVLEAAAGEAGRRLVDGDPGRRRRRPAAATAEDQALEDDQPAQGARGVAQHEHRVAAAVEDRGGARGGANREALPRVRDPEAGRRCRIDGRRKLDSAAVRDLPQGLRESGHVLRHPHQRPARRGGRVHGGGARDGGSRVRWLRPAGGRARGPQGQQEEDLRSADHHEPPNPLRLPEIAHPMPLVPLTPR